MLQFPELLKDERLRLGLTQDEVADACGISKRALVYYEKGERPANSDFLQAFVKLGADINYLFTGNRSSDVLEEATERMALLVFNRLKEGQKTSAINYMVMLEAGKIKGDFHTLWEFAKQCEKSTASVNQTAGDDSVNNNQVFHASVQEVTGIKK